MAIDPNDFDEFAKKFDKLSPEERDELLDLLEERRTTLKDGSDVENISVFEAMNRRGMAGSIKDAPADWSTNPKYLEGLGRDAK